ncbi:Sugar transporter [Balamuthia mandrillaris]
MEPVQLYASEGEGSSSAEEEELPPQPPDRLSTTDTDQDDEDDDESEGHKTLDEELLAEEEEEGLDYEIPLQGEIDQLSSGIGGAGGRFNWRSTLKTIAVSGVGFFSDAYDLFVINLVLVLLSTLYELTPSNKSLISSAVLVGALCGQLLFGFLADKIGRKKGFVITLSLVISFTLISACVVDTSLLPLYSLLAICRFLLGIGIGGEYPLSATITAESSETHQRGRLTAAVFSMQGIGACSAALVAYLLIVILGADGHEWAWRLSIAVGAIPGLLIFYFRLKMEETSHFQRHQRQSSSYHHPESTLSSSSITSSSPKMSKGEYMSLVRRYWRRLLGTAGTWFLLDVTFYANALFSSSILKEYGLGQDEDAAMTHGEVIQVARFNVVLTAIAIPGYWCAVYLIETSFFGRKRLQWIGFLCLSAVYFIIAIAYKQVSSSDVLFFSLYAVSFFFTNVGPNTTTYVLAAESFPTKVRATCHGVSAAAGKLGAALGSAALAPVMEAYGLRTVFAICGVVALIGAVLTVLCVTETRGKSLDEIAGEEDATNEVDRLELKELTSSMA